MQPDMWEASIKCELLVQKKLDYMRRVRVKDVKWSNRLMRS